MKMLRVARRIEGQADPCGTSFLGAHAVPRRDRRGSLHRQSLPASVGSRHAEGLVDAVDGFVKGSLLTPPRSRGCLTGARSWPAGETACRTAEPYWRRGTGGSIWRDLGRSCGICDACGCRGAGQAGTVAVLLPGAFYTIRETQAPPVAAFRDAGVPMAVATDWNPGSSPLGSCLAGDEHGLHPVPSDARRSACRDHAQCGPCAWAGGCGMIAAGNAGRSCRLGRRTPGRAVLWHRIQPPQRPHFQEAMTIILHPETGLGRVGAIWRDRGSVIWRQHGGLMPSPRLWPGGAGQRSRFMASTPGLANWPRSRSHRRTRKRCSAT